MEWSMKNNMNPPVAVSIPVIYLLHLVRQVDFNLTDIGSDLFLTGSATDERRTQSKGPVML